MRAQALGAGMLAQSQSAIAPFRLHRPTTLTQATVLVAEYPEATIAAGCSDLVARIREGERIERLISLQRVAELREIDESDGMLRIGAAVSHHDGSMHPIVRTAIPGFAAAWSSIATVRIRYTGTIGGNVMAARTRYEMPLLLGALGAEYDYDATGRLLCNARVDTTGLRWFGYERSMRPTATLALAVRAAPAGGLDIRAVAGSEYRPGYTLTAHAPGDDLRDLAPSALAATLADQLPDECADHTGSADYRRHLVKVLTGRILRAAVDDGVERTPTP
ncbi:FAD binding domain-containing protein [Gordonia sp. ABSL11-1]|uniref:FAD binding domain-containing protein n=1 Tax=Gordonia sp. ABSL11-1 TaxID=3053924 RepID=UPI002572274A|nr:FAD binding domain-containing protein [Gordonia sp. ABSL11-1]MDL9947175.1 FAD binding domain-containing protein [Gordonia sp. ABSL11-1]